MRDMLILEACLEQVWRIIVIITENFVIKNDVGFRNMAFKRGKYSIRK